jgi:hypothetical protein
MIYDDSCLCIRAIPPELLEGRSSLACLRTDIVLHLAWRENASHRLRVIVSLSESLYLSLHLPT